MASVLVSAPPACDYEGESICPEFGCRVVGRGKHSPVSLFGVKFTNGAIMLSSCVVPDKASGRPLQVANARPDSHSFVGDGD